MREGYALPPPASATPAGGVLLICFGRQEFIE